MSARTPDNLAHMASLPEGWHRLYLALLDALADGYEVDLAKQKFGAMRIYGQGKRADWPVLDDFAARSRKTCEICGQGGRVMVRAGWYRTLCSSHAKEQNFKIPSPLEPPDTW